MKKHNRFYKDPKEGQEVTEEETPSGSTATSESPAETTEDAGAEAGQ